MKKKILLLGVLSLLLFTLVGCSTTTTKVDGVNNDKKESTEDTHHNKNLFEGVKDGVENMGETVKDSVESVLDKTEEDLEKEENNENSNILEDITSGITDAAEDITESMEDVEEDVKDNLETDEKENEKEDSKTPEKEVVETTYDINYENSINSFTEKLAKVMNAKGENVIFSPYSIYTALLSSTNGSTIDNEARQEILKALEIEEDASYKNIGALFNKFNNKLTKTDKSTFLVANSVWLDDVVKNVDKNFTENMVNYFDSDVLTQDLQTKDTVSDINEWVSQKTNDFIKNLNAPISDETVMLLLNSVYFKGTWTDQFKESLTTKETFNGTKDTTLVDTMHANMTNKGYLQTENVQAVRLNYLGNDYCMEIYIPTDNNNHITDVIDEIDLNNVTFNKTLLNISLPKFETEYQVSIDKVLNKLGINRAFNPNSKYFDLISDNAYIGTVLHKAKIVVDEEGTEAAAVTAMAALGTSMNTTKPLDFTVDCPFVYVIRNLNTNTIVFYGVTNNIAE